MGKCQLQYLPGSAKPAHELAAELGLSAAPIVLHRFPDGELRVTVPAPGPTTILYATFDPPNEKLLAVLFAAEALRRNGCRRLILIAPYLCYMRQDTAFQPGEGVSQKVIGELLSDAIDRVITVNAHLHRTTDIRSVFPGIEADNLSAMPTIAKYMRALSLDRATIVVGPDEESYPMVSQVARDLDLTFAVAQKTRQSDSSVTIALPPKDFRGRPVLLVDDIVSSGSTLVACAHALKSAGVSAIDAVVVHALFPADQIAQFELAGIRSVRSTDSLPHPSSIIPLAEVLADALRHEVMTT